MVTASGEFRINHCASQRRRLVTRPTWWEALVIFVSSITTSLRGRYRQLPRPFQDAALGGLLISSVKFIGVEHLL